MLSAKLQVRRLSQSPLVPRNSNYTPDGKIAVKEVKLIGKQVMIRLKNITMQWEINQASCVEYVCYNKAGKEPERNSFNIDRIHKGQFDIYRFTIPSGTAKIVLKNWSMKYWMDGWL